MHKAQPPRWRPVYTEALYFGEKAQHLVLGIGEKLRFISRSQMRLLSRMMTLGKEILMSQECIHHGYVGQKKEVKTNSVKKGSDTPYCRHGSRECHAGTSGSRFGRGFGQHLACSPSSGSFSESIAAGVVVNRTQCPAKKRRCPPVTKRWPCAMPV